jgi:hypothetical protein
MDYHGSELGRTLGIALDRQQAIDRDVTIKVGVLLGLGEPPAVMPAVLGVPRSDVGVAIERIRRVSHRLGSLDSAAA